MPASTGTDGRAGRLRAVQATASASTSRATRNFISRPTSAQPATVDGILPVRPVRGASRALSLLIVPGAVARGETPAPFLTPPGPLAGSFPTHTAVRENLDISPSSSSSHVWKLGRTTDRAGQPANRHVGRLWVDDVLLLSTRGQLD